MPDRFYRQPILIDSPANDGFPITPNDANTFSQPTRGLYVGVSGNVKIMMDSYDNANTVLTLAALQAGVIHPIRVKRVYSGNTTASSIVGFY